MFYYTIAIKPSRSNEGIIYIFIITFATSFSASSEISRFLVKLKKYFLSSVLRNLYNLKNRMLDRRKL